MSILPVPRMKMVPTLHPDGGVHRLLRDEGPSRINAPPINRNDNAPSVNLRNSVPDRERMKGWTGSKAEKTPKTDQPKG